MSCGEMWSKICHMETFLHMINVETIFWSLCIYVAIYAVLAQNLFCCNLRAFVWRKIYSKIVLVEKKGQISGMAEQALDVYIFLYFCSVAILKCQNR